MGGRGRRFAVAAGLVSLLVAGCDSGSNSSSSGANGGAGRLPTPSTLVQSVYYLDRDTTRPPKPGTQVVLLFEPGGKAALYLSNGSTELGHHGTWSYDGAKLSLAFKASDFHPTASFALKLGDATVTMPFQVFSTSTGTSTWKRGSMSLLTATRAVFGAVNGDPDMPDATPEQAVDEAFQYAQERLRSGGDQGDDIVPAARIVGGIAADAPKVTGVTRVKGGLEVSYDNGKTITIVLQNWNNDPADASPLRASPLASDPRTHLNAQRTGDGSADPAEKTATFIAPFRSGRYYGIIWHPAGTHDKTSGFNWDRDESTLKADGYSVTRLEDKQATLTAIIKGLGGGRGKAPGLVILNSHAVGSGEVATGVDLGEASDTATVAKNYNAAVDEAKKAGFGDLFTFNGGSEAAPKTLGQMSIARDGKPNISDLFLSLKPDFWKWLAGKGVTFDKSMVYIAACLTNTTSSLRDAIHARAYLAWSNSVNPLLAGGIADYFVDDMVRPTHSAEEAFFNVVRIVNTRQKIYVEDNDLDAAIPGSLPTGQKLIEVFAGYAWDGSKLVDMPGNGWLDVNRVSTSQVWWLVWAGRWGSDSKKGAQQLVDCYNTLWSKGTNGGLASPYCNAANTGRPPKQDEVAVATHGLTGTAGLAFGGTLVPRFTLNDGRT